MYTVIKRMEISAAHSLKLSYRSKCEDLHGHNWIITVYCRSRELNADGMVVDFSHIKETVKGKLDHRNLNEVLPFNPFKNGNTLYLTCSSNFSLGVIVLNCPHLNSAFCRGFLASL